MLLKWLLISIIGLSVVILSIYYIIVMTPSQTIRDDYLGWMSQYTAVGALGVMIGIYIMVKGTQNVFAHSLHR